MAHRPTMFNCLRGGCRTTAQQPSSSSRSSGSPKRKIRFRHPPSAISIQNSVVVVADSLRDKDKDKDVVATAELPEMSTCSDAERTHFLEQLTAGADALRVASTAIQNDHSSVFAAVSQSGWALAWASPALRARREIVMAAVSI